MLDCTVTVLLSSISDDGFYMYVHRSLEDTKYEYEYEYEQITADKYCLDISAIKSVLKSGYSKIS
jgi:hypothetical protein